MIVKINDQELNPASTIPALTKGLTFLLAFAASVSIANLYYSQPLLVDIVNTFHVQGGKAGLIATLTQLGYATGIFLFVPLGDIRDKRKIILIMICMVAFSLLGVALAPSLSLLYFFSFCVGLTTGIPQIIVPLAAQLAPPDQRGKVIGTVVSAALIGVLLARTVSGSLGYLLGWRWVFAIAALTMCCLGAILYFRLPHVPSLEKLSYKELIKSFSNILKKYAVLRRGALTGALVFGSFSVFWTSLTFLLKSPAYHMNSYQIGLFGLVGAFGAFGARVIGGLNDKKDSRLIILACVSICLVAYAIIGFSSTYIYGVILGVIVLDFGIMGTMVSTQSVIYSLSDSERSRLNTVFIVSNFLGGALGSTMGSLAWEHYNWSGVCWLGGTMLFLGFLVNLNPLV